MPDQLNESDGWCWIFSWCQEVLGTSVHHQLQWMLRNFLSMQESIITISTSRKGRKEKTYCWYQYVCEPRMRLYGPPRELLTHLQKLISDNVRKSGLDIPPADTKWSVEGACEAPKINIFSREKVKQLTSHTSSWNSWRLLVAPRFLEDFPFGCRRTLRAYLNIYSQQTKVTRKDNRL